MWTSPELLKKWFGPGDMRVPAADVDLRCGGKYRFEICNDDGEIHTTSGVYEEIVPNEKLVFSWKWADSELVTRVTVVLRSLAPDKTELITLTHEGFTDVELRDKHNGGWSSCLDNLEAAV